MLLLSLGLVFAITNVRSEDTLVFPRFHTSTSWIKSIESTFDGAQILWSFEQNDYYLAAVWYKEHFFVCLYPKNMTKAAELFYALAIWNMKDPSGTAVLGPQAAGTEPQMSLRIVHASSDESFTESVFYYGVKINLPDSSKETTRIIFPRLEFELHVENGRFVTKYIAGVRK